MSKPIKEYVAAIKADLANGIATEHTYRPALKSLLENLGGGKIVATNEPKRIDVGAPDFDVSLKADHGLLRLGHVEAKDVGKSLEDFESTEQFARYSGLHNLVVSDYLSFRWYIDGELKYGAVLGQKSASKGVAVVPGGDAAVEELLLGFLATAPERIKSARILALRMARLAHLVRDIVIASFKRGSESSIVGGLRKAFSSVLLPDLSASDFADMYAQTLAYGLFAARANHVGSSRFTREQADHEIPKANPFLRRLFSELTGPDFEDEPYAPFVDVIAQLLADADLDAIFKDFGKEAARDDPVVHFYETFLTAYDPAVRELRGVYYTPLPVVSFIVRSVDTILRDEFGLSEGFADVSTIEHGDDNGTEVSPRVLVLDPAVGTGTFSIR